MPAISQIGFGTNDYASIDAWWTAEKDNDYGGAGPIAEISSAVPQNLTATFQARFGTASKFTIRAASGSEFNGNFGGTHAKITGGQTIDIRQNNFNFENLDIDANFSSTGDTYDNARLYRCGWRGGQIYLDKNVTNPFTIEESIVFVETETYNRAVYTLGCDVNFVRSTVIAIDATGSLGAIYVRTTGTVVNINDTAVYSNSLTVEEHSGDTVTVAGNYNAGNDALLPGANSISTLGQDDFTDFVNRDFRILGTSELVGAGSGGGDIGAFTQVAVPVFTIDSFTNGALRAGNTLTINHSNANAAGKTATIAGQTIALDTQDANTSTLTIPDPKTFGDQTLPYNTNLTIEINDVSETDTITIQIAPGYGHYYDAVAAVQGIYVDDVGIAVGDHVYGYFSTGFGNANVPYGALQSDAGATFRYWVKDATDGVWGTQAEEVIPATYSFNATLYRNANRNNALMGQYWQGNAPAIAAPTDPVIVFTDLISVPRSGWSAAEPTKGAVLSIWGRNFGSFSAGNTYVSIGGVNITELAEYPTTWGAQAVMPHLQEIRVHLNSSIPTGLQTLTVTSGGVTSNALAVRVTENGIYFADATAAGAGTGTHADPWQNPLSFTSSATPGDVLYLRQGTFTNEIDGGNAVFYIRTGSPTPANDAAHGTAQDPIGIVGYPGEDALLNAPDAIGGNTYRGIQCKNDYWTFSSFRITSTGLGVDAGGTSNGRSNRVIGMDVRGCQSLDYAGHIITQGSGHKVLGNFCHGGRSGNKLDHAIYVSGDSGDGGCEVAYNYCVDNNFDTGPIITINHQDNRIPTEKYCKSHHIHHNFIDSTAYPAIGLMNYDQSWDGAPETEPEPAYFYNNFLTGCGVDRSFPAMSDQGGHGRWYFNHVHNCKGVGLEMAGARVLSSYAFCNIFELTDADEPGGWEYIRQINLSGADTQVDTNLYQGSDGNLTAPETMDSNAILAVDPGTVVDLLNASFTVGAQVFGIGINNAEMDSVVNDDYNLAIRTGANGVGAIGV